jgi:molybdopterin-binding protein
MPTFRIKEAANLLGVSTDTLLRLLSREAADELALGPGMLAVAAVKATNVCVEIPKIS